MQTYCVPVVSLASLLLTMTFSQRSGIQHQYGPKYNEFINLADVPCGLTPSGSRLDAGRIIGGTHAQIGEFPSSVSLQSGDGAHFCGGVIVDRYHILTAAHCFIFHLYGNMDTTLLNEIFVVAGTNDMKGPRNGQRVSLKKLFIHPGFSHFYPDFHNDIAIVRVRGEGLEWGSHVQPACLSKGNDIRPSPAWGYVAGWGVQSQEDKEVGLLRDGRLKKVALPIWSNRNCQEAYTKAGVDWMTKSSHLCAGTRDGSSDSCSGDSGSALFTRSDTGYMVASGLVSGGEGCSTPGIPGIYTRISSFIPWIRKTIQKTTE